MTLIDHFAIPAFFSPRASHDQARPAEPTDTDTYRTEVETARTTLETGLSPQQRNLMRFLDL